ncbi:hypothetical protein ACFFJT_02130 [Dyella flava]|uniref:Uncharacterized protein n=1 Tax=Dyella flava TaxID=1920170 RepID=A0ABS2K4R0_9GAMM|nr:hypothetical protein [Dyella flava]MBM7126202.1 hypothetical protein [Dyella flava]GLQ48992.1 hypothetical protein GCM10010872_04410 [Dyella flava]
MTSHDGLLLLGGVVVLYLYDSALLLYHNEIMLIGVRRGYRVSAGSGFEFGGRHVFLPQPLFPHQPLFRLSWPLQGVYGGDTQAIRFRRVRVALAAVSPWTLILLLLFALGLPFVLFVSASVEALLAWIATVYAVIVMMLVQVYRHRKALNLSGRAVAAVALDALLCAPFALNIVRKIGLRQHFQVDLRMVARTVLPAVAIHELTAILRERIHISLGFLEPGDADASTLVAYLDDVEGLHP